MLGQKLCSPRFLFVLTLVTLLQTEASAQQNPTESNNEAITEFRKQPPFFLSMFVQETEWTEAKENEFSSFVVQIGQAVKTKKCGSVKTCMRNNEANRYAHTDPFNLVLYSDCADFPYFLRAYFAYKNGLPMNYVESLTMNQRPYGSTADRDQELATAKLENSPYGNSVSDRGGSNVGRDPGWESNLLPYLTRMFDMVSTRTLRISPLSPNYDRHDFYPVKLNRQGIKPGTITHSTGHAGVVFDVDSKGVISIIDAHPDGSISTKIVKPSTMDRSRPDQGLGFYAFRPIRLVGARRYAYYYGGKLVPTTDLELYNQGKYSLEQWFGPSSDIKPGSSVAPNAWKDAFKKVSFFDLLQSRLRLTGTIAKADEEVADQMKSLCDELQQRVSDVDLALAKRGNLNLMSHPPELPQNIFSSSGPWEEYSTPGRDGRMRGSAQDIFKTAVKKYRQAKSGDPTVTWPGTAQEFVTVLLGRLDQMDKSCVVSYMNSKNAKVSLKFSAAVARLNRMSFDPYHCAEKRWGAAGDELKSCRDQDSGNQWFDAQKYIRNFVGKINSAEVYVVRSNRPITMGMLLDDSLVDLPDSSPINLGTKLPPITNLRETFIDPKFLLLLNAQ